MTGRTRMIGGFLAALAVAACGDGPTEAGPDGSDPEGVDFGFAVGGAGAHAAAGAPSSSGNPLDGEFAVAARDSLDGLVVLSYDAATSDLFILQIAEAAPGTWACGPVEVGPVCHARYFENVRVDGEGVVQVDGRLDLTSGTVTLETIGADRLVGTFSSRLERTGGEGPPDVIEVTDGSISVALLSEGALVGGLDCLIALTGAGERCGG